MKKIHNNQSGLIAIVVTIILMFVLSLIVIAFSRLTLRNQRQALDRQLNTQAFYAAESGINDGIDALRKALPGSLLIQNGLTNCTDLKGAPYNYNNVIDAAGTISYSCLLVDTSPPSLVYSNLAMNSSEIIPLEREDGTPLSSVSVFWQDPASTNTFSGCPLLAQFQPTWNANCDAGMLQIDIVPVDAPFNRTNLIDNTATFFVMPSAAAATPPVSYASAQGLGKQGTIVPASCKAIANPTNPKNCSIVINGLGAKQYYMRLMPLYRSASVTICTPNCSPAAAIGLVGAQALVDSTGKATDVLRRVQVHVDISNLGSPPSYAVESTTSICKRFGVVPATGPFPATVIVDSAVMAVDSANCTMP